MILCIWNRPCVAIPKALKQAGLNLAEIEQTEPEAFAVQALAVIQEAGLNPDTVNVNGGAIAWGTLGCTNKLTIQLLNEMKRREQRYGMMTLVWEEARNCRSF